MSTEAEKGGDGDMMMFCGSCGIAEDDDIKLKKCNACKSVRYCGVKCQKEHRPQHKKECKKRVAELRDEVLFHQPESIHGGDCPICCLPLPIDPKKSMLMACCCKVICIGCEYANFMRQKEGSLEHTCSFCREKRPITDKEVELSVKKRIEVNDPVALCQNGIQHCHSGDFKIAFELLSKAAELGNIRAHFQLSNMYRDGQGVEKDKKKQVYHLEQAAIGGDPDARYNLGCVEKQNGRFDRAVKHFMIAANLGHDGSLHALKECFKRGLISKEDFADALRAHQAAVDATKSPQREAAAFLQNLMAARAARQS